MRKLVRNGTVRNTETVGSSVHLSLLPWIPVIPTLARIRKSRNNKPACRSYLQCWATLTIDMMTV
jgi:hypothetical protein